MKLHRPMWTTREGEMFPVDLMSDRHLDNAMMMLRRQGWRTEGDMNSFSDRMSRDEKLDWASRPVSYLLTALAAERLHRIEHKVPPVTDEQAQAMQRQWAMTGGRPEWEQPAPAVAPSQLPRPSPGSRAPAYNDEFDTSDWCNP